MISPNVLPQSSIDSPPKTTNKTLRLNSSLGYSHHISHDISQDIPLIYPGNSQDISLDIRTSGSRALTFASWLLAATRSRDEASSAARAAFCFDRRMENSEEKTVGKLVKTVGKP